MTTHRTDSTFRRTLAAARRVLVDLDRGSRAMFERPGDTRH